MLDNKHLLRPILKVPITYSFCFGNSMVRHLIYLMLLVGCQRDPLDRDPSELSLLELKIDPKHLSELETTVAGKNEVPGKITVHQGATWRGMISYSGKSSLYHRKRGYQGVGREGRLMGFKNFRLSAQVSDPSFMRNLLTFEVYASMGFSVPKTEFVEVYLNGDFQGLYLFIEEVDRDFFKTRGLDPSSIYKARFGRLGAADLSLSSINQLHIGFNVVLGDERMFDLKDLIMAIQDYQNNRDNGVLDWNEVVKYHAVTVFLKHWDGFKNNYILHRAGDSPLFHWVPWDGDQILQDPLFKGDFTSENALWGFNEIASTIINNPILCQKYLEQLSILAQAYSSDSIRTYLTGPAKKIALAYRKDPLLGKKQLEVEIDGIISTARTWQQLLKEKRAAATCL